MTLTAGNQEQQFPELSPIATVKLYEEKLKVTRRQQKIGEVIVRKQVETRMVQIPISREKLIVERVGQNPERLTEVVISEGKVNGFKYDQLNHQDNTLHTSTSQYLEVATAQQLLEAIANLNSASQVRVRLEIVSNDAQDSTEHQRLCDRHI